MMIIQDYNNQKYVEAWERDLNMPKPKGGKK